MQRATNAATQKLHGEIAEAVGGLWDEIYRSL
jgi:hypothetical protein